MQWSISSLRACEQGWAISLLKLQISLWGEGFRGDTSCSLDLGSVLNVLGHSDSLLQLLLKTKAWGVTGLQDSHTQVTFSSGVPKVTEQAWGHCCCTDCQPKMACASSEALVSSAIILKTPFVRQWESKFKANYWESYADSETFPTQSPTSAYITWCAWWRRGLF